jgi:ABC-type phosphate/phosphonate transport system substrate-binding protein
VILGAVAYDPKVVDIWEGFKLYFERRGLSFDFVLFSNYERQVEALIDGVINVAWNSPLAWIRSRRLAQSRGLTVRAIAMRDSDCDLASVIVARSDSRTRSLADLKNKIVAVGAIDSPQATLIPLAYLHRNGLSPKADFSVQRYDELCGKHGDHIGGERKAAVALSSGNADAACMSESNYALFRSEGLLGPDTTRVLALTPLYDHCNLTAGPLTHRLEHFCRLLLEMSYEDPDVRPLFDLEGLRAWREGRVHGYGELEAAVDELGFYDQNGNIVSVDYPYR